MAGAIRNACVARGEIPASGFYTAFTVPDSHVLLLKDARSYAGIGVDFQFNFYANGAGDGITVEIAQHSHVSLSGVVTQTWLALNAGDQIIVQTNIPQAWYWISGALLPFASTIPPGVLDLPQYPVLRPLFDPTRPGPDIPSPLPTQTVTPSGRGARQGRSRASRGRRADP